MLIKQFTNKKTRVPITIEKRANVIYNVYENNTRGNGGSILLIETATLYDALDFVNKHYSDDGLIEEI